MIWARAGAVLPSKSLCPSTLAGKKQCGEFRGPSRPRCEAPQKHSRAIITPPMPLAAGTQLGPYEIISTLGAGGMGEVYRARDSRLARDVALKILPGELATDPDRRARFEREARAAGQIHHPNILSILDIGVHHDMPFIVTELLEGETLRERLRPGPLPQRKAIEIASQIAKGLGAAHDKGIVHRDIKPENIFISGDGHVKILDFGLASAPTQESVHPDATVTMKTASGMI